jgi:hypothetical protein
MTLFVQYFIPCKRLYMFQPKNVEPFTGNKILYKKRCHIFGKFKKKIWEHFYWIIRLSIQ